MEEKLKVGRDYTYSELGKLMEELFFSCVNEFKNNNSI